jgi:hypothetical protein
MTRESSTSGKAGDNEVRQHRHEGVLLAIVIPANYHVSGIHFVTDDASSQQVGFMSRPKGYASHAHRHTDAVRRVTQAAETLFVRSGRCRLELFANENHVVITDEIGPGDVVHIAAGGHRVVMLEDAQLIEVKQGPFLGPTDIILIDVE